jgi:hypothetical protein
MLLLAEHGLLELLLILSNNNYKDLNTIKAILQDYALKNGYEINANYSTTIKAA